MNNDGLTRAIPQVRKKFTCTSIWKKYYYFCENKKLDYHVSSAWQNKDEKVETELFYLNDPLFVIKNAAVALDGLKMLVLWWNNQLIS